MRYSKDRIYQSLIRSADSNMIALVMILIGNFGKMATNLIQSWTRSMFWHSLVYYGYKNKGMLIQCVYLQSYYSCNVELYAVRFVCHMCGWL